MPSAACIRKDDRAPALCIWIKPQFSENYVYLHVVGSNPVKASVKKKQPGHHSHLKLAYRPHVLE